MGEAILLLVGEGLVEQVARKGRDSSVSFDRNECIDPVRPASGRREALAVEKLCSRTNNNRRSGGFETADVK